MLKKQNLRVVGPKDQLPHFQGEKYTFSKSAKNVLVSENNDIIDHIQGGVNTTSGNFNHPLISRTRGWYLWHFVFV